MSNDNIGVDGEEGGEEEPGDDVINCVVLAFGEECCKKRNKDGFDGDLPIESDLQSCNFSVELDHELVQDILGRMILHWNYRNLKEIPPEVLEIGEHIEEIYLKRNSLVKLPSNIGKLCNLTNLYLVGNQLEELPKEIGSLVSLKVFDLSQNYIQELPSGFGDLQKLESLLLTYNQLEKMPQCLKKLCNLKVLELSGNRITSIPEDIIWGLESLEEFGIDRNFINFLPRNLCQLKNLYYFSACRCNLMFLPSMPFFLLVNRKALRATHKAPFNVQFLFDGNPRLNYIPYWVLQMLGNSVECFGCGLEPGKDSALPISTQSRHNYGQQPRLGLIYKGKRLFLYFDEDFAKLHYYSAEVPSLLELCLRQIHHLDIINELTNPGLSYKGRQPVKERLIIPEKVGQPRPKDDIPFEEKIGPCQSEASSEESPTPAQGPPPKKVDLNLLLPKNLINLLRRGPSAKCFECLKPIFTESWPLIFSIPGTMFEELNNGQRLREEEEVEEGEQEVVAEENENRDENEVGNEPGDENEEGEFEEDEEHNGKLPVGCAHFCSNYCILKFRREWGKKGEGIERVNQVLGDIRVVLEIEWRGE